MAKELRLEVHFPYSRKLIGDNAAMIGIAAWLHKDREIYPEIDRRPRWSIEDCQLDTSRVIMDESLKGV